MQLTYEKQFIEKLKNGTKFHTIRPLRKKRPFRVGDILTHIYGGRFQKKMEIIPPNTAVDVLDIYLDETGVYFGTPTFRIEKNRNPEMLNRFAVNDGFENFDELVSWFLKTHNELPFQGQLICWAHFFELYPELKR